MNRNKTIKTFPFLPCVLLAYPIPIRPNVKNDMAEGTKNVRETSDMVRVPTEYTK